MFAITEQEKDYLRKKFPTGQRVELLYMDDWFAPLVGTKGTVTMVDDIGTVHIQWDDGSTLGVAYGIDSCKPI